MEGFRGFFLVAFLLVWLFFPFVFSATPTILDVPNNPPELQSIIPNQSWEGGLLSDAFNLNDYFYDYQGDNMTFNYTAVSGVDIIIDSNGSVSFNTTSGLIANRTVYFNASDGVGSTPSNLVYLFIGTDNEAPKWSSVSKDKNVVYQNDNVVFSTHWTDNFALRNYSLYLDQGSGFELTAGTFSGKSADSSVTRQISAPQNKIVYWKFCAEDTSSNLNCTNTNQFTVAVRQTPPSGSDSSSSSSSGSGSGSGSGSINKIYYKLKSKILGETIDNYTVSVNSFLVSLKQGNYKTLVFEVVNHGSENLSFSLDLQGLEGLVFLSDGFFSLDPGQSKTISLDFKSNLTTPIGEYLGVLVVNSTYSRNLPITYYITKTDLDFEVSTYVLKNYKSVNPGEVVVANVTLVNLKDIIQSKVKLYYAIKDFYGEIYYSEEEDLILDTFLEFKKELNVPEELSLGDYIFYVRASNEKDYALGVDDFQVGSTFRFLAFLKSSFIFLFIFVLSIIIFLLFLRYKRQREKERALNLYVRLVEMRDLIKKKNFDAATNVYISIKNTYGEPLSDEVLKNKGSLIKEMKKLSGGINFEEIEEKIKEESGKELKKGVPKKGDGQPVKKEISSKKIDKKILEKKGLVLKDKMKKVPFIETKPSLSEKFNSNRQSKSLVSNDGKGFLKKSSKSRLFAKKPNSLFKKNPFYSKLKDDLKKRLEGNNEK